MGSDSLNVVGVLLSINVTSAKLYPGPNSTLTQRCLDVNKVKTTLKQRRVLAG